MQQDESFTVSLTSLSVILFSFFVFLNSIANPDLHREREVVGSVHKQFSDAQNINPHISSQQHEHWDMPIPELGLGFPKMSFSTRYSSVANAARGGNLKVQQKDDRFIISIGEGASFTSGDDQIRAQFIPILSKIAKEIRRYKLQIEIEGHTDNKPISTSRFSSNWELSIARAVSVLRFFIDKGIPAERLSAKGRAGYRPIANNKTEQGRAKNRRVVLTIKK